MQKRRYSATYSTCKYLKTNKKGGVDVMKAIKKIVLKLTYFTTVIAIIIGMCEHEDEKIFIIKSIICMVVLLINYNVLSILKKDE